VGNPIIPVLVGDTRSCDSLSSKRIVGDGGQEHAVVVSDEHCGSTHLGTA
jgi:hypothetical protein